jgi:hypothetical protein
VDRVHHEGSWQKRHRQDSVVIAINALLTATRSRVRIAICLSLALMKKVCLKIFNSEAMSENFLTKNNP